MEEINKAFQEYMDKLKTSDIQFKRSEVINSIKELIVAIEQLSLLDNISLHYLRNEEIKDLRKSYVSEDDFLEATLVYLEVAKNIIGEYLENISINQH